MLAMMNISQDRFCTGSIVTIALMLCLLLAALGAILSMDHQPGATGLARDAETPAATTDLLILWRIDRLEEQVRAINEVQARIMWLLVANLSGLCVTIISFVIQARKNRKG
jgi:hypothetical protein